MRELDAWIAEHVMGWHRMTNVKAMGVENFEGFTESELGHINELSDHWYDFYNKHIADVNGECDCGQHDTGWKPTTERSAALEVLEKCYGLGVAGQSIVIWNVQNGDTCIELLNYRNNDKKRVQDESLQLAICLFAKKLFSNI